MITSQPSSFSRLPAVAMVVFAVACGTSDGAEVDSGSHSNLGRFLAAEEGWESLFDGETLDGWVGDTQGYVVEDGAITCTPEGRNLLTAEEYGDFLFDFEFKLAPGSNNGIGIRYPGEGDPAYAGIEVQVLDDGHPKYNDLHDWQFHGSLYGVVAAERGHLKPAGEWNRQQIIAIGDRVKVVLNGVTIVDAYDLSTTEPIHDAEHPGLQLKSGHIAFCGHGDFVAYRNLRVRTFDPAPPLLDGNSDNTPPDGFTALFNGENLAGWRGLLGDGNPIKRAAMEPGERDAQQEKADAAMRAHWSVENGELVFDGEGASLCSAEDYGDFDLYVDWKIPSNADSGIYVRSTPQIQIWDPANPAQRQHGNEFGSGGLWNNKKTSRDPIAMADRPIGEWNTFHLRMLGERVTIWLNGTKVVDNQVLENYWDPENPVVRVGAVELQNHGQQLWFKNIYLRELPF